MGIEVVILHTSWHYFDMSLHADLLIVWATTKFACPNHQVLELKKNFIILQEIF